MQVRAPIRQPARDLGRGNPGVLGAHVVLIWTSCDQVLALRKSG